MTLLNPNDRFPYCNVYTVFLKCNQDERLRKMFLDQITLLYTEAIDCVYPILNNQPTNQHFTYGINVVQARSFYDTQLYSEVYPWHVNPVGITVPYGNIENWYTVSTDWRFLSARAIRAIFHASRLIPNDTPTQRKYVNLGLPWLPLDKESKDCTMDELNDYGEMVLSILSSQIWVQDRQIFTPHIHVC